MPWTGLQPVNLANTRYQILAAGQADPDSLVLQLHPDQVFIPDPDLERRIEQLCTELRSQGRRVERLPVYRVLSRRLDGARLVFEVGTTDYGTVLARRLKPEWFDPTWCLDTLAVSGVTRTDRGAILERRSAAVAASAGLFHVKPSGQMQPPESPYQALVREANEELGLDSRQLIETRLLGLIRCHEVLLDVVFASDCRGGWGDGRDAWEHTELLCQSLEAEPLATFCTEQFAGTAAPGHGALFLQGWCLHGRDWANQVWSRLPGAAGLDPGC